MTTSLRTRPGRGFAALGLLPLLALAACNNDPQSGGLTITYSFPTGVSCNEYQENVVDVRVDIGEVGEEALASESATCNNEGGEIVLAGVPAGNYDLFVLGIDDEGDAVLDNLGGMTDDDRIEIIGGDSMPKDVVLGLAPARLEVRLAVELDDFQQMCTSDMIEIKGLRIGAYDIDNAVTLHTHDFDLCDFSGYLPVPDEDREINGRAFDTVTLQPLDAGNAPIGDEQEILLGGPVGAGKLLQLDVTCDGLTNDCEVLVLGGNPGTTTEDPTGEDPTGDETGGGSTGGSGSTAGTAGTADGDTTG
jgi:hypothetical protein